MLALVQTTAIERESDRFHDRDCQLALLGRRNSPRQLDGRTRCLEVDDFLYESLQAPSERREDAVDLFRRQARTELIDQRVIGTQLERLTEQRGFIAREVDDLFEVRGEQTEVALLLRLEPTHLRARGRLGEARDEILRRRHRVLAGAAHLAQVRELPIFETLRVCFGTIEQARHARRAHERMAFRFERRKLLATKIRPPARHHHRGIPPQHGSRGSKRMQTSEFLFELLVWGQRHEECRRTESKRPFYRRRALQTSLTVRSTFGLSPEQYAYHSTTYYKVVCMLNLLVSALSNLQSSCERIPSECE